jgi:hypothetical protein
MDDPASQLLEALDALDAVADQLTADEAVDELDTATLQELWQRWPAIGAWAGAVWRRLNADLDTSAHPTGDPDLDEIGGSG